MNEEVREIKKIREDMVVMIKDFNKNINEMKNGKSNLNNIPQISNAN